MKILLNEKLVEDTQLPCGTTALAYLRDTHHLTGTKEGCASGDCGACTIMVGDVHEGAFQYRSVNACITPIAALEGKHVVTVEHLKSAEAFHPAQSAMVTCHGSQCGFCTPGFVMSLATLYEGCQTVSAISREAVCEAISGNLCRCTGYRPIVDAGLRMGDAAPSEKLASRAAAQIAQLHEPSTAPSDSYFLPETIAECRTLLTRFPEARIIAGGTDLMLEYTQRFTDFSVLIDISRIPEITSISNQDGCYTIGAACTYAQLDAYFGKKYEEFHFLFNRIAAQQVRNRGTLGGNICNASPIADLPPVLLAFDAELSGVDRAGKRFVYALNDFYLDYKVTRLKHQDLVCAIHIDTHVLDHFFRFYKVSKRLEDDISSVLLALRFHIEDDTIVNARIAFGGVAAVPLRVEAAEAAFKGKKLDDALALSQAKMAVAQTITPLSDVRASANYRLEMACALLEKAYLEAKGETLLTLGKTRPTEHRHA